MVGGMIPRDSWYHERHRLERLAKTMDPAAKLRLKTSKLWGVTSALKTFAITIGSTVYIPAEWSASQVEGVLPHEILGHMKQFRWCGLWIHPDLGLPLMAVLYLLVFLPVYLAWGRYRLELHAETKSWCYHLENRRWLPDDVRSKAERSATNVSGAAYVWAVPRPWALWGFRRRAEKVIARWEKIRL